MKAPPRPKLKSAPTEVVPPGWYTTLQLCKAWKVSESHAWKLIKQSINDGSAVARKFRVPTVSSGWRATAHYRFKQ